MIFILVINKFFSYGYKDSRVMEIHGARRIKYRSKSNMIGRLPIEIINKTEKTLKEMFIK